jgi:hypothetical protein
MYFYSVISIQKTGFLYTIHPQPRNHPRIPSAVGKCKKRVSVKNSKRECKDQCARIFCQLFSLICILVRVKMYFLYFLNAFFISIYLADHTYCVTLVLYNIYRIGNLQNFATTVSILQPKKNSYLRHTVLPISSWFFVLLYCSPQIDVLQYCC